MKRLVNYRILFFISIIFGALILGICEIYRQNYFWGILSLIICCLVTALILFFKRRVFNIILIGILCLLCILSTALTTKYWQGKEKNGEILFTLSDDIVLKENLLVATGKDIKVNGNKIDGNVLVYITLDEESYLYNLNSGDKLLIYSDTLMPVKIFDDGKINNEQYRCNIKYTLKCDEYGVRRYSGKTDALSYIREKIKDIVFSNIKDKDSASVAFAMITGDKNYISSKMSQSYKTSGLAHILAVSGMNISFLIICIGFLFSKIKGFRLPKFLLTSAFIVFYCALCGFVPSVTRAGIMGIVLLLAKTTGHRADSLNSLGFASIVLLLIKPLYIYDLSFLLSFASVFAIVCLYSPIAQGCKKIFKGRIGKNISELIAMTLSANIGIYPLMAYYFNTFSLYSLLVNIVLLPLVNIAFILLFASCILTLIIPILGFLIKPSGWIIWAVNKATYLISGLPYAEIIIFSLGAIAIIYYLGVFVLGGYINIPKKFKAIASILLAIFFSVSITATNISAVYKEDSFTAYDSNYCPISLITTSENSKHLIGEINDFNYPLVRKELITKKIRKVDTMIITKTPYNIDALTEIAKDFFIQKIAVVTDDWALCDEIEVITRIDVTQIFDNINYSIDSLAVYSYSYDNIRLGTAVVINKKTILYPLIFDKSNSEILNTLCGGADIAVTNRYNKFLDCMVYLVCDNDENIQNVINLSKNGNFEISL